MHALPTTLALAAAAALLVPDDLRREGDPERRAILDPLEGQAPPPLAVRGWMNTDGAALALEDLRGKVVLLDFWGVWCGPCRRSIPHLAELHRKHREDGLVVIGLHTNRSADGAPAYVEEHEIPYPVCIDERQPGTDADEAKGRTAFAYHVDGFPDYYLIDRAGRLRFADLANEDVDRAVAALLAEAPPPTPLGLVDDWPQGSYSYLRNGEAFGTWTFRQERVERDGRTLVRMQDVLKAQLGELKLTFEVESFCEPNALYTPIEALGRVEQTGESAQDLSLAFADGCVEGSFGGRRIYANVPEDVSLDMALFRIASRMPFEEDAVRAFTAFELEDMRLAGTWTLTCKGRDRVRLGEEEVEAWLVERTAESKQKMSLWYGDDRRLLRASWDGSKELVLVR